MEEDQLPLALTAKCHSAGEPDAPSFSLPVAALSHRQATPTAQGDQKTRVSKPQCIMNTEEGLIISSTSHYIASKLPLRANPPLPTVP